jgi:hypothetical protein
MEGTTSLSLAKEIFGNNFIGPAELNQIAEKLKIRPVKNSPTIPFDCGYLKSLNTGYILILSVVELLDGSKLSLKKLRDIFSIYPDDNEPCFYFQDWYINEDFYLLPLELKWNLIKIEPFDDSRGLPPDLNKHVNNFPSANLAAYTFFSYWLINNICLWPNNYIWCKDNDSNGDRIYVGRYYDINGKNKNGFSIHRHLSLREYHCAISAI